MSKIDLARLRDEFAGKARRKATAIEDIRQIVEAKLAAMLAHNLDVEQRRAAEEGLSEEELALFDLLKRPELTQADRERVKQASRSLLASIQQLIAPLERWTEKEQTQAEVEVFILDRLCGVLPNPPFTPQDIQAAATRIYRHVWQQSVRPTGMPAASLTN